VTRILRAGEARKYLGKHVKWWPLAYSPLWGMVDTLHEVSGKNVRIGSDWQWLPDIWMEAAETPLPEEQP
jgi:hypothetical protein